MTFRWSFTIRQSGRVRRWSGSPSAATALASATPGAVHARMRPRPSDIPGSATASPSTRHLGEERLYTVEMGRPREALRTGARGVRERGVRRAEGVREGRAERAHVLRVVDDELRERAV